MASPASVDTTVSPAPPTLRRLPWPRVAPVDLATEFPWLILHQSPGQEWESRGHEAQQGESDLADQAQAIKTAASSVYAQRLRVPRPSLVKPTPAQRAARKMLELQDVMERREAHARRLHKAASSSLSLSPPPHTRSVVEKPRALAMPNKETFTKRKKAPPTAAATTPSARLQQWLARQRLSEETTVGTTYSLEMETRIHHKMHTTLGAGLWADEVASPIAAQLSSESVFGGFSATRRLAFVPPTTNETTTPPPPRPREDSIHHPKDAACEVSTASTSSNSPCASPTHQQKASVIQQFASDARDAARAQAEEGDIAGALETLQHAIDHVRLDIQDNQDELRERGFDFAPLAHAMARRLQHTYKRRHRKRVASLVVLQRAWRRTSMRRAITAHLTWRTTHATAIQRALRSHWERKRRYYGALRIQRCFRIFQSQKLMQWLHRACRLLTTDFRRAREAQLAKRRKRRRLWERLTVVLTMLRVLMGRRRAAVRVQSQWRRHDARQQYAERLRKITELESLRRSREDVFVESRLTRARQALQKFYGETAGGEKLVAWRLRAPWLRWRRVRTDRTMARNQTSQMEMMTTLQTMYAQRNGTDDVELRGLEARCVGVVLGLRQSTNVIQFRDMGTFEVATSETQLAAVHNVDKPPGHRFHHRLSTLRTQWRTQWTSWRRVAVRSIHLGLWTLGMFPKLVLETSFLFRGRRRRAKEAAIAALLGEHDRVLRVVLRCAFRSMEKNRPKYECKWCGAGIATAGLFYAHRQGCVEQEQIAQQERVAIAADVAHHEWWNRFLFRRRQNGSSPSLAVVAPTTFAEDAPYVRRVAARGRRIRSHSRAALRCLVDAAQCCSPTVDESEARLPLALLASLVWLLDGTSGHSLERIHAAIHCDARLKSEVWIRVDEAAYALGLAARPHPPRPLRTPLWTRAWQRLRAKWTPWLDRAAARYHMHPSEGSNSRWGRWRQRTKARVVASA